VVNGGALGTPSSGTVTNLTGTASININGTVGATTANTGAFTTLSATKPTTIGDVITFTSGAASSKTGYLYVNTASVVLSGAANGGSGMCNIALSATGLTLYGPDQTKTAVLNNTGLAITGTLSATGVFTGSALVDANTLRATGNSSAATGSGAEMLYSGGSAYFLGFNRTGGVYLPVILAGTTVDLNISGTSRLTINTAGIVTMSAYGAGAATFSASGVISSVSDETWKIKDGAPVDPDAMLNKLQPGYWYYNDEKKETFGTDRQLGFYAQNVNAAIGPEAAPEPETVTTKNEDGTETIITKPWGYYDRSVLAVTVMSLQKALATIELLTARITALEAK
jgi:hypothetical protein